MAKVGALGEEEVRDYPVAELSVHDLRMELQRVEPAPLVASRGVWAVLAFCGRRDQLLVRFQFDERLDDHRYLGE